MTTRYTGGTYERRDKENLPKLYNDRVDSIVEKVSKETGWPKEVLTEGRTQRSSVCRARYLLWYTLHKELGFSGPEIADYFDREACSVYRGIRVIEKLKGVAE